MSRVFAATDAVDVLIRLDQLDEVRVASAVCAWLMKTVDLCTLVTGSETVLLALDATSNLNPPVRPNAYISEVGGLDKVVKKDFSFSQRTRVKGKGFGAERDRAINVVSDSAVAGIGRKEEAEACVAGDDDGF